MDFPKKARITSEDGEEQDRISRLPDDLLHKILKFVDIKLAVQTSVLSKRCKLVWTTLPFLYFRWGQSKLIPHVFSHRSHQSQVSELEIFSSDGSSFPEFVDYAISHHVQHLYLVLVSKQKPFKLSMFSSTSIRELKLIGDFPDFVLDLSDSWDLPALTTLHLEQSLFGPSDILEHCLTSLPALRTLHLACWDLQESSFSFNLPALTSLSLFARKFPTKVWNFPALKTLTLSLVEFPEYMSEIFGTLVSLQSLTLRFLLVPVQEFFINCPQLVSLEINTCYIDALNRNIVVFAPKLTVFTSVGIFPITFGVSKLDNVNIKLGGWIVHTSASLDKLKEHYQRFSIMLHGLGNAKMVKLDLETIEALSLISDYLATFPSPFYSLKYLKIPQGCKEESISTTLRNYLLGGSPAVTIVTRLPQNKIPHTMGAYVTAQNVVIHEPLVTPTNVLFESENIHKTVDIGVQEQDLPRNSEVHADSVRHVGGDPVASSSKGNSDFGIWRGHEVNSEFARLLDLIMNKYPETFEHFTTTDKKFSTMKLNMLCTSVNDFTKISMTNVDTEMIAEYRDVFASLQKFGFNISWLVSRLNYIEQLRFSQPLYPELHEIDRRISAAKSKLQDLHISIDDTKTKLLDLQSLRAEKMQEIKKAFGTMGTNLVVGYIGDDLISGS